MAFLGDLIPHGLAQAHGIFHQQYPHSSPLMQFPTKILQPEPDGSLKSQGSALFSDPLQLAVRFRR
jgi:hypothetical protein